MDSNYERTKKSVWLFWGLIILLILIFTVMLMKRNQNKTNFNQDEVEELFIDASDWVQEDAETNDTEDTEAEVLGEENDTFNDVQLDNQHESSEEPSDDTESSEESSDDTESSEESSDDTESSKWFHNFCF